MSHNFIWKNEKIVGFDLEIPIFESSDQVADAVIVAGGPHLDIKYLEGLCFDIVALGYQPVIVGFPGHMGTSPINIESYESLSTIISTFLNSKFVTFPRLVVGHSLGSWLANTFLAQSEQSKLNCKLIHFCIPFQFSNKEIEKEIELVSEQKDEIVKLELFLESYFLDRKRRVEVDLGSLSSNFMYFIAPDKISSDLEEAIAKCSDSYLIFGNRDIMSIPSEKYEKYTQKVNAGHFPMLEAAIEIRSILKKIL